jgi:copper ion binding protein
MSSTIERATLTAPDISCAHCVATINKAVGGLDGVSKVTTDEQIKQIAIEFDPARVSLAQIEATLDEEGYPVQRG